jgi:hypothetical protein
MDRFQLLGNKQKSETLRNFSSYLFDARGLIRSPENEKVASSAALRYLPDRTILAASQLALVCGVFETRLATGDK